MNTPKPYLNHAQNIKQYSRYRNYSGKQGNIRDSKDSRYAAARNNRPVQVRETRPAARPQGTGEQGQDQRNGRDNNNNQSQRGDRGR